MDNDHKHLNGLLMSEEERCAAEDWDRFIGGIKDLAVFATVLMAGLLFWIL